MIYCINIYSWGTRRYLFQISYIKYKHIAFGGPQILVYKDIFMHLLIIYDFFSMYSPNKRSFRGPGGVVRGLDL